MSTVRQASAIREATARSGSPAWTSRPISETTAHKLRNSNLLRRASANSRAYRAQRAPSSASNSSNTWSRAGSVMAENSCLWVCC
jgi:hypothetical protein